MLISNRTAFGLTIEAPAKVNLNLEILGRRDDGFHEIDSLFQAVSLCDRIEVSMAEEGEFELSVSGTVELPEDESNIVTKAFRLMQDRFALKGGLRVELQKRIPIAAGLGGGSADGAAAMLAINLLYGLGQSTDALAELSGEIGSD